MAGPEIQSDPELQIITGVRPGIVRFFAVVSLLLVTSILCGISSAGKP